MEHEPFTQRTPWTLDEVSEVIDNAGFCSLDTLAYQLGRDVSEVDTVAVILGLDVSLVCPDLQWCDTCASWRTTINKSGQCRICQMREQIKGREDACSEVWGRMPKNLQQSYIESESLRHTRKASLKPRPVLTIPENATRHDLKALKAFQAEAIESWEYDRLMKVYNASKKRLQRMREHLKENPRKSKPKETENAYKINSKPLQSLKLYKGSRKNKTRR